MTPAGPITPRSMIGARLLREHADEIRAAMAADRQVLLTSSDATRPRRSPMDWTLEVVLLPVSDIDASVAFYRDKVGFHLDHDTTNEFMHVVQLTPRGSGCSIVIGDLPAQREMAPGSMRGLQLVVADAQAARRELLDRGVEVSEITVLDERDGGTFFGFSDPDGNTWTVQQLKVRGEKPLIPLDHRERYGEGVEL